MRLLKGGYNCDLVLTRDQSEDALDYVILSHTWGADEEEVTYDDLENGTWKNKAGHAKILFCAERAHKDGVSQFWVDTCCINKANFTEYSEAITSMFRWYQRAQKCYVYMSDVSTLKRGNNSDDDPWKSAFRTSRWFKRGWTLQELIAPACVEFFSREGTYLGDKSTLEPAIHEITQIPVEALRGAPLETFDVTQRMRWANDRVTKRQEDKAYCMLGILKIFMPLIYGERENAMVRLREEINKRWSRSKPDLDKLPYAQGANFESADVGHVTCHPATRIEVLNQVQNWAIQQQGKSIFWLNGMAGTGKSTIAMTFAEWLAGQPDPGPVTIAATFFFMRGGGDRGNVSRFFPTLARQLAQKIPGVGELIADAISSDPLIMDKALGEHFKQLIYEPLLNSDVSTGHTANFVIVVDALDECGSDVHARTLLELWSRIPAITAVHLKLFITSRPELPIRLGFANMPAGVHEDMILQDFDSGTTVQEDIFTFLDSSFSLIRNNHNAIAPSGSSLPEDWPGEIVLRQLADMATPLFIVAATMCRFIGDANWDPGEQLDVVMQFQGVGHLEQMERTYLPVLKSLTSTLSNPKDRDRLFQEFRIVVGSVVVLAEPLSTKSLGILLHESENFVLRRLNHLHSVIHVPRDPTTPVTTLHLSFREFLLSSSSQSEPFGINSGATHSFLLSKCLQLLSGPHGLHENLCGLTYEGQLRAELEPAVVSNRLFPALQYACRNWVHHALHSNTSLVDGDDVHIFMLNHFLHWLEALSLMGSLVDAIGMMKDLQAIKSVNSSTSLSAFLEDAARIVLTNRYIIDIAPLQTYSSVLILAPQESVVRKSFIHMPRWLHAYPLTRARWSAELQTLEGHKGVVSAVTFSPTGSLLVSASWDHTIKLWDTKTGLNLQTLAGHTDSVNGLSFAADGSLLASCSSDLTIRLWNPSTGFELSALQGHTETVHIVAFSPDSSILASGSDDATIRLWDPQTGQAMYTISGHSDPISALAFSPVVPQLASCAYDSTIQLWNWETGALYRTLSEKHGSISKAVYSPNGSILVSNGGAGSIFLWDPYTGHKLYALAGHYEFVRGLACAPSGLFLAAASDDNSVKVWNLPTLQEFQTLQSHTQDVYSVAFSPDGLLLASASFDRTIKLWDPHWIKSSQPLISPDPGPVSTIAFSPDGIICGAGSTKGVVMVWHPRTGQQLWSSQGHTLRVTKASFSPCGSILMSVSPDGLVSLWNSTTGEKVRSLRGGRDSWSVVFSPNGTQIAYGSASGTGYLWDRYTGEEILVFDKDRDFILFAAFSPDNKLVAFSISCDSISIRDTETGHEVQAVSTQYQYATVLRFSPDKSQIAGDLGHSDVYTWDITTGDVSGTFTEGHEREILALDISPDGRYLACASDPSGLRLWDLKTGEEVGHLQNVYIEDMKFSTDSKSVITNRGIINSGANSYHQNLGQSGLIIQGDWICRDGVNLLWLPPEYRRCPSAFHGNTFAFGLPSGLVSFIRFRAT